MNFNIISNRSFCYDFITEGWTKKDWALNLLPLGGVASVVYEMGSALCTRDRTTKIAQEFFKSPTHTAIKKLAQCLWLPIIACGAIKVISIIVTTCWNRCFPPAYKELPAIPAETNVNYSGSSVEKNTNYEKDSSKQTGNQGDNRSSEMATDLPAALDFNGISIPKDICLFILSFLTTGDLAKCREVRKSWRSLASTHLLWKAAVYREMAFTSQDWAQHSEGIVKAEDRTKEISSLPDDIARKLNKSYKVFPGKKLIETHVLVRIPEGLTIKRLGDIAKKYFPNNVDGYKWCAYKSIIDKDKSIEPCWILMTKDVLPESRNKNYTQQQALVADLAKQVSVHYVDPEIGEVLACTFAHYLRSKDEDDITSPTYIRCQREGYSVIVGFDPNGLAVSDRDPNFCHFVVGVTALQKF